jgi:hypothetical protein
LKVGKQVWDQIVILTLSLSKGKDLLSPAPGKKQVFRFAQDDNSMVGTQKRQLRGLRFETLKL